ncbi:MAG: triple tyrosine motif-containing protein [Lentimicrobiaceae bacterium]|jgi:ligand-binding sensor domain-containing protein/DNA-binding CsgD family transcriptional regulator
MKNIFLIFLISLSIHLSTTVSLAQTSCLVTHYTRSQYEAGSQNWSMDMDKQGFVYAANNDGLVKYDGVRWQVYRMPAHTIVRSVSVSSDGRIYTGSNEEFGYWTNDSATGMKYTSLVPLLKGYDLHNQEIWKIVRLKNKVYFQGFSSLFVYDQHTVKSINLPGSIIFLLKAGDRLFAHAVQGNLYELKDDKMVVINQSKMLYGTEVKTILPYKKGSFLIGTSSKGVFILDKKGISPWDVPANHLLKEFQINNGILFGDKIVFGTIVKGLFIMDYDGQIQSHLFSENNLQNNTVLSLCNDNNQSIWVGLDNGIDNVSFNNPVDIYPGRSEAAGTVYTAAFKGNTLYVGTNRGIFMYSKDGNQFLYQGFLQNSQGQVWQLKVIDGILFCGHTNGTYIIEKNKLKQISSVSGGYMLQKITIKGVEYLIQSTYTSLVLYKKFGNSWVFSHQVEGFLEPARFIETDHLGNIWIGHSVKGLYRIRLSESLNKVIDNQLFNEKDGLPSNTNIKVFKIANRVVFSNGERLYTWDDLKHKIIPYSALNTNQQEFEAAVSIIPVDEDSYWFVTKTEAALFSLKDLKSTMLFRIIFTQYNLSLVDNYENIVPLTENLHLICLDNGFAIYKKDMVAVNNPNALKLVIRDFICRDGSGNLLNLGLKANSISLKHAYNNITISFSTLLNPCSRKLYQYKLESIEREWSKWSESAKAEYTRLPVGQYTFKVRTLTSNGTITEPISINFRVRPAWYASIAATLIYLILGLGGILASQYFYRRRLAKHHNRLHMIANEKRKVEKQNAEQEIMKLQNEKLQAEVSHKNMQLADSTLSIIRKNEVLIEIKDELEKQKEELGPRYPARYLQRLTTLIDKNISNDNDWEIFEALFDQAHENFFKRLKQSFPDLTQSDLKLCAYLKLNLSSKEIAPLLNISVRGVEIRRYRLRKRLALSSDHNLVEYIMQF